MKVTANRGYQAQLGSQAGVGDVFGGRVAAGDHFYALAAKAFKFGEQSKLFVGAELVARWVRHHSHTTGIANPGHRVFQGGPAVFHVARLALSEVLAKHLIGVLAHAGFHHVAGKVGARDQVGVTGVGEGTFKRALDTHTGQVLGHVTGALGAAAAGALQSVPELRFIGIKAQANDMHCLA